MGETKSLKAADLGESCNQKSRAEETSTVMKAESVSNGNSTKVCEEGESKSEGFVSMKENQSDFIMRVKIEDGESEDDLALSKRRLSHSTKLKQDRKKKSSKVEKKNSKERVDMANNIKDESDDDVPLVKMKAQVKRKLQSEDGEDFEEKSKKKRREIKTEQSTIEVK